jgi:hypothetical protein
LLDLLEVIGEHLVVPEREDREAVEQRGRSPGPRESGGPGKRSLVESLATRTDRPVGVGKQTRAAHVAGDGTLASPATNELALIRQLFVDREEGWSRAVVDLFEQVPPAKRIGSARAASRCLPRLFVRTAARRWSWPNTESGARTRCSTRAEMLRPRRRG